MSRLTADVNTPAPGEPIVLRVAGTLDPHTAPELREALVRSLCHEPSIVVLDVNDLRHAAASAVTELVAIADRAYAWPGAVVALGGPPSTLTTMLGRAGAAGILPSFPTVAAALAAAHGLRAGADDGRLLLGLSAVESAAANARRLVDRACLAWDVPALRDTARLIVTELVSNAVRHANGSTDGTVEVALARQPGAVYVSVRDRSRLLPRPGGPVPPTVEGGRGLLVVELMSRAWGATPTVDGKVVWASLATG